MPESVEDYYARIIAAADSDRVLPVAVEEMPGWDIFPYEVDSLRLKPLQPILATEPDRAGEDPATCWCATADSSGRVVWRNERWSLIALESGLPVMLILQPRAHHDLPDLPDDLARELGLLTVAIAAATETLPSVGRAHVAKIGDGGAHLHVFFIGRPARIGQFRGSPLLDWEENLPRVPVAIADENACHVAELLVQRLGGEAVTPTEPAPQLPPEALP